MKKEANNMSPKITMMTTMTGVLSEYSMFKPFYYYDTIVVWRTS